MTTTESHIEKDFIEKLAQLKYTCRPDIRDRASLEQNFRSKFEALNRVQLTDAEFARLLDEFVTPAVKAIVDCIHQNRGNGYIWHTTGSGKTLTSFKASTLLKDNPDIEKCLFVVDRKDLDRQTREEFNKFQDGCVEENTNIECSKN